MDIFLDLSLYAVFESYICYTEIVLSKWIRKEEKWKKFQIGKVVSLTKSNIPLRQRSQTQAALGPMNQ